MAKLDKFLSILHQKGGHTLRLDPGEFPVAELPGGHRMNLGVQELIGPVLDGLAKEVVPGARETDYLRGEKVQFPYEFEGQSYIILCVKSPYGTRVVAAHQGVAAPAAAASVPGQALWEELLGRPLSMGASDLFLNPGESPIVRCHGRFTSLEDLGTQALADLEQLGKSLTPKSLWEAFGNGTDVEFSLAHPKRHCRLRINLLHGSAGPALAVRMLPDAPPEADSLGLREEVKRLAALARGLVLLSGPKGSGRSTALACLLQLARKHQPEAFLVTVEDAIAFPLAAPSGLTRQREVGGDPKRQSQAIRTALAQQPDILAVDEWSGPDGLEPVLEAACEGRLVFLTLQAATAHDSLRRVVEGFPKERRPWIQSLLAGSLKAAVNLDLVPARQGGRVLVQETLFNTPAVAERILNGAFPQIQAAAKGARYGQMSQAEALAALVKAGTVEAGGAYLRCGDREALLAALRKAGVDFDPRKEGRITEE